MEDNLFDVAGRTVVITGGLGQLGRQFTDSLVARGARVAVLDLPDAIAAAPACAGDGTRTLRIAADVCDRPSMEHALERIVETWGVPFGLVNNAALDAPPNASAADNGPFEDLPAATWRRVVEVNLTGSFIACQVIGGAMARVGQGSIVNVASIYGMVSPDQRLYRYRRERGEPFFKPAAYSASKSALYNLTRYLATYWGPQGVRVNTVSFAGVFNHQDAEFLDAYTERVPLARMAGEAEYNGAIVFLLSAASSYMTGSNLVIDGGFTAW